MSPQLTIEPGDPIAPRTCDDCGGVTTELVRWVHTPEGTLGAYYARFSDNHPERDIALLVLIGKWGDGAEPKDRYAFSMVMRVTPSGPQVMVVDAAQSPWNAAVTTARMLDRADALAHPRLREVFSITDLMVLDDSDIRAYIEAKSRHA